MSSSATSRFPIPTLAEVRVQSDYAFSKSSVGPADVSDEALMVRLNEGDKEALSLLYRRYVRLVRRICERILRDDSEAEDLTQDVFLCIQQKCGLFDRSKGSAPSWIVHMAYHRAFDRRRRLISRHFYNREDIGDNDSNLVGERLLEADYSLEAVFGRNGLEKVLNSLSKDQRETLRLYFFEGYRLSEISTKTGQPLGNVRHHYYRALDKLRKQMFGRKVRGS